MFISASEGLEIIVSYLFIVFSFWSYFFGLKMIIPCLSPLSLFIVLHSFFSSLWHFHFSFLCFENGPWSLGIATRSFFSNPFRFFSFCFVSVLFWLFSLPLPWKLSLEIIKRSFFSNPFRCFFRFCIVLAWYIEWLDPTTSKSRISTCHPSTDLQNPNDLRGTRQHCERQREPRCLYPWTPWGKKYRANVGRPWFRRGFEEFLRELLQIFFGTTFLFGSGLLSETTKSVFQCKCPLKTKQVADQVSWFFNGGIVIGHHCIHWILIIFPTFSNSFMWFFVP